MSGYELPHKEVEANIGALKRHAFAFDNMFSSITGRSASFNAITNTTATSFSELIDDDIRAAADENQEAWGDAMLATIHAQGVITLYVTAVETYEEEIESLKEELARVVASSDDHSEKQEWVEYYKGKADEKWATLETSATEASESLATGPTPEGIRALVEGGHLGDIPGGLGWIVTGDDRYFSFPPGIDGNDIARTFDRAADGDEGALGDLDENLALMNAFLASVASRQEKGEPLTERELEILGDLVGTMDLEAPGYPENGYFFSNMNDFQESEHLTQEQKDELLATMGGSVLALSDESIGGGYDQLPQSIHEVVEGPLSYIPYSSKGGAYSPGWASDFEILTEMFDSANGMFDEGQGGPLIGGTEMSANLTGTVAGVVEDPLTGGTDDETLQTMLDISTQNKEANYAILTGEYPDGESYMHPTYFSAGGGKQETEFDQLIASLLSHEWDDEGAAVRGLIGWISEDFDSSDESEKIMAGEAMAGFVETISTDAAYEELINTGVDVVEGDQTYKDASFTHFNVELSHGMADLFDAYIFSFAEGAPFSIDGDGVVHEASYRADDGIVSMDASMRATFMQYLAGNDETALRMVNSVEVYREIGLGIYFSEGDVNEVARGAANLDGLVDIALRAESADRFDDLDKQKERERQIMSLAMEGAGFGAEFIPVVGSSISMGLGLGSESFVNWLVEEASQTSSRLPAYTNIESVRREVNLAFLEGVLGEGQVSPRMLPQDAVSGLFEQGVVQINYDGRVYTYEDDFTLPEGSDYEIVVVDDFREWRPEPTEDSPLRGIDDDLESILASDISGDASGDIERYMTAYTERHDQYEDFFGGTGRFGELAS